MAASNTWALSAVRRIFLFVALSLAATAQAQDPRDFSGLVEGVHKTCTEGGACPFVPGLVPYLYDQNLAWRAAKTLGYSGDARAVSPLMWAAVYSIDSRVQRIAETSLLRLADTGAQATLEHVAALDPDPSFRSSAQTILRRLEPNATMHIGTERDEVWNGDPEIGRVQWTPTAFIRPEGVGNWSVYNLGYHRFNWGVHPNIDAGGGVLLPAGVLGFMPDVKFGFAASDLVNLGGAVQAGFFFPFIDGSDLTILTLGGSVIATIGTPDIFLNLAVSGFFIRLPNEDDTLKIVMPHIGFSARMARRLRFNVELLSVFGTELEFGDVWPVLYGFRIFGENMFGDVGFVIPIFDGVGEILEVIPLGFPMLTFGMNF